MLYGRDVDRARIGALLERARASRSGVLVLRGEPGVGKTALLEDTIDRAADMRVLQARGVESECELPFAALHRFLRPALAHLDALPGPQAAALRGALGLGAATDERFLVYAACLTLLAELAEQRPVLCIVDDAHWLDAASGDALLFVARRLEAEGIVMLFGAREGDVRRFEADDLPSLHLGGVDDDAAMVLLAHAAAHDLAPAVRDRLLDDARGNALALLELPSMLSVEQLRGSEPLPDALPLTRQLERVFLERVRRLAGPVQRALLLAAADDTERLATLSRTLEIAGLEPAVLDDAERAGLVVVHGTRIEFRHPLVRSAVYGAATARERAAAHGVLARALTGDAAEADRRAWHLAAAALEPDDDAVQALEEAAARARDRAGHPAAARALERAAELTEEPAARGRRLVAAARAASLAGRTAHAAALAERALPLVDDPLLRAEIARVRAVAAAYEGRSRSAHRELLQAAREVGGAKAWELLTQAADSARELGDAEMVLEICAVAEAMPADTPAGPAAQAISGFGAVYAGDQERGLRLLERAVAAAEASSDPRDMITIGFTASWLGRHEQAERLLDQAAALARAQGAMETLCHALAMRAPQLGLAQRFDDAAVAAAEAVRLCRELGFENRLPVPLSILAITNATRGQVDDARRLAEEAHRLGLARGSGAAAGTATWALAVLDVTAGRWEQALARFERIARPAPGVSTPFIAVMVAPERVEMARRVGRIDVARTALADFEAWAAQMPAPWPQPVLECCRALVADGDEATARYQRALERAADARPLDLARIRLLYGEHLRRERRRVDARVQLRAALDGFERLNAVMWAERARAELRASGETARRRDPSTLGQLTPQELQVGQLVASGLSNKEVAAQLFLSTRTIEAHLRSVFSKLEVTSRTQLARLPQFGDPTDASTLAAAQAAAHE